MTYTYVTSRELVKDKKDTKALEDVTTVDAEDETDAEVQFTDLIKSIYRRGERTIVQIVSVKERG